jgi:hypothetical protein
VANNTPDVQIEAGFHDPTHFSGGGNDLAFNANAEKLEQTIKEVLQAHKPEIVAGLKRKGLDIKDDDLQVNDVNKKSKAGGKI